LGKLTVCLTLTVQYTINTAFMHFHLATPPNAMVRLFCSQTLSPFTCVYNHYGPQTRGGPAVHPRNGKISRVTAGEFEPRTRDILFPQVRCPRFLPSTRGQSRVPSDFADDAPAAGFFRMYRTRGFSRLSTGPWERMRIFDGPTTFLYLVYIWR
jgi:hypothetical protein